MPDTSETTASSIARFAPLLVIIAATCWGLIGLFSRTLAAHGYSPLQIAEVRCVLVALVVGVALAIFRRDLLKIELRDIPIFLGSGIVSFAFFNICYFACIEECSLSVAAILLYTGPIFVMVLSCIFFKERFTARKAIALVLAFAGCLCVVGLVTGQLTISVFGVLVGLGSGLGYGLYSIFGNVALTRGYNPFTVVFYTFVAGGLALAPFADLPAMVAGISASADVPIAMLLLALLSTLVPFTCYTYGLKHLETGRASIMTFVEPMVATIVGVAVFGDVLTPYGIAGIVLIGAALVVLNVGSSAANKAGQGGSSSRG